MALHLALARTIERKVIPQLIFNSRQLIGTCGSAPLVTYSKPNGVSLFCNIILTRELEEAEAYVAVEIAEGADRSRILIDLLAPTARRLGQYWDSDEFSFVDVTIALAKLQQLVRLLSDAYRCPPDLQKLGSRALLATVPDNQHLLGLLVVEELFRQAGWTTFALPKPSRSELLDAIAREWFAVVGLSISCDKSAETLASLITEIRAASVNSAVLILIGGSYVTANPEQSLRLGADLVGADAPQAIEQSQKFLTSMSN